MSEQNTELDNIQAEQARLEAEAELKALTGETESVETEAETEEVAQDTRVFTDLEKEQMAKGWDPDHPDGVSAKEFKRVGEIIEAKRKASKEVQAKSKEVEELRNLTKKLIEQNKAVQKAAYEKALSDLYEAKIQKVEEGDVQAVIDIERRQAALKPPEEIRVPEVEASRDDEINNHPEIIAFREEFKDMLTGTSDSDIAVQAYIQARANKFQAENPNIDVSEALSSIRDGLKQAFPYKFKNPNKELPGMTTKSTTSSTTKTPSRVSQLSFEDRKMLAEIKAVDPSYTDEEFISQLKLTGKFKE